MASGDPSDPLLRFVEAVGSNYLGYLILLGLGFLVAQFFLNFNRALSGLARLSMELMVWAAVLIGKITGRNMFD
jgi:hypothetical protein